MNRTAAMQYLALAVTSATLYVLGALAETNSPEYWGSAFFGLPLIAAANVVMGIIAYRAARASRSGNSRQRVTALAFVLATALFAVKYAGLAFAAARAPAWPEYVAWEVAACAMALIAAAVVMVRRQTPRPARRAHTVHDEHESRPRGCPQR